MEYPDLPTEVVAPLREGEVTLGIDAPEKVTRAQIEAAVQSSGPAPARMEIESVEQLTTTNAPLDTDGDILTLVAVTPTESGPTLSDVRFLLAELGDDFDALMHAGRVDIQPSVSQPEGAVMEDVVPALVVKVERSRGTPQEFRQGMEALASTWNPLDKVYDVSRDGGTNVGYAVGNGTTLQQWRDLLDSAFSSRGAAKTDMTFDAAAVLSDEYARWLDGGL